MIFMVPSVLTDFSQVWKCFQQYSVKYHEQFIAAARVIAEIICLVKYSGIELWEAMASWLSSGWLVGLSLFGFLPGPQECVD